MGPGAAFALGVATTLLTVAVGLEGYLVYEGRTTATQSLDQKPASVKSAKRDDAKEAAAKIIARAERAIKMELTDPYSARFEGETIARTDTFGTTVCGLVNSKTPYGGYGGQTLFVAWTDIEPALVVMNIVHQPPGLQRAAGIGTFLAANDDSGCGDKSGGGREDYDGQIASLMNECLARKAKSPPDATFTNHQLCLIDTEFKIKKIMGTR
jgi:hypothetical protein